MLRSLLNSLAFLRDGRLVRTRRFIQWANDRDYERMAGAVTADFTLLDTAGARISGRDGLIDALRELHRQAPDLNMVAGEIFAQDEEVLVKGRLCSGNPDYCSDSLWRFRFAGEQLGEIQSFRTDNAVSLPRLTAHLRRPATPPLRGR